MQRNTKYPIVTDKAITRHKTKPELLSELRDTGFQIKGNYTIREIKIRVEKFEIPLEKKKITSNQDGLDRKKAFCKCCGREGSSMREK